MSKPLFLLRSLVVVTAVVVMAATGPLAFGDFFDNDASTGAWEGATNWNNDVLPSFVSAEIFLEDLNNALPLVSGIPTVTLSSGTQEVTSLVLGAGSDTDTGSVQLLVTGGVLNLYADSRIGRGEDSGVDNTTWAGDTASLTQTGGTVNVIGANSDIKIAADGDFSPDAIYSISGGTLLVGLGDPASDANSTITLGESGRNADATLEIIGSAGGGGPTSVEIDDLKMNSGHLGNTYLSMVMDAGGVTPLICNDELQMENLQFKLSLSDVPPAGAITLALADRLSNDNQFVGIPDGSDVTAAYGGNDYTWTITYTDGSNDATLNSSIVLDNLRISPSVPEPSTILLLGMAVVPLALRRRRSR